MQTIDYRIGNWVAFQHDTCFRGRVTRLSQRGVEEIATKSGNRQIAPDCIIGNKLTKNNCKLCGFEETDEQLILLVGNTDNYFEWDDTYKCVWFHVDIDWEGTLVGEKIEYVHQLQNLFFALTHKELEISPDIEQLP